MYRVICKQWQFNFFSNLCSFYFFFFSDCCVLDFQKPFWVMVVRVGNLVLFLILEEVLFSHKWECLLWVYHIWPLLYSSPWYSMSIFYRVFVIINGYWSLSVAFSASIEMIIWFLFFSLLICYIILIDLHILKNPCIPGMNPTWSWCMVRLMCCWIWIARVFVKDFCVCVH